MPSGARQPKIAPNQKLIFMPLESSGVIGAIGGIAELAKSAMEKNQG